MFSCPLHSLIDEQYSHSQIFYIINELLYSYKVHINELPISGSILQMEPQK